MSEDECKVIPGVHAGNLGSLKFYEPVYYKFTPLCDLTLLELAALLEFTVGDNVLASICSKHPKSNLKRHFTLLNENTKTVPG